MLKTIKTGAVFFALLVLLFGAGCATTPVTRSAYVPANEEGIATRGVDMYDYQLVVEKMVRSMLQEVGIGGKKPVIALGPLHNNTPYNIETGMLGEDLRIEVMRSKKARFSTATSVVRKGGESGELYRQLEFQNESGHVNPATAKKYGGLVGADYLLYGNIYSIERRGHGATEANFKYNLTMTEVKTGLAVWAESMAVRKMIR